MKNTTTKSAKIIKGKQRSTKDPQPALCNGYVV